MSQTISETDVEAFLAENPDFLLARHELLMQMQLAAPRNGAIPLIERQADMLRERNSSLRDRLQTFVSTARDNDILFEKTRNLVLAMMQAQTVNDLAEQLKKHLHQQFDVDFVELFIFSDQFEGEYFQSMHHNQAFEKLGNIATNPKAMCGVLTEKELTALFDDKASRVQSTAVQPFHYGIYQGLIALGSRDPNRYRSSIGTLFLSYVGDVVARMLAHLKS